MTKGQINTEIAIFAGGCFWGIQAVFDQVPGVINTIAGYSGGSRMFKNPGYKLVCTGITGHAESVKIEFDPRKISYNKLLEIFWMNHNPTTKNRQGLDIGTQYRSAIFYTSDTQKKAAIKSLNEYQKKLDRKIVTEIVKAQDFYPAEDYHQKYYKMHAISCQVILPQNEAK